MTTRNFRVHNGISVGDITISASANTITGMTTTAPSADFSVNSGGYEIITTMQESNAFVDALKIIVERFAQVI